jgi:hypothetical protein
LIPALTPIRIPRAAQPVNEHLSDYEVELAVVIGKDAKDVPESEALNHVLGYTGANDVGLTVSMFIQDSFSTLPFISGLIPETPTHHFAVVLLQVLRPYQSYRPRPYFSQHTSRGKPSEPPAWSHA